MALIEEGRKLLHVVMLDSPITVRKVPKSEQRYMSVLEYPVKKAKRLFRKASRQLGITKGASKLLKGRRNK